MDMEKLAKRKADWKAKMRIGGPTMMIMMMMMYCQLKRLVRRYNALTRPRPLPPTISRSRSSCSILGADPPKGNIVVIFIVLLWPGIFVPISLFVFLGFPIAFVGSGLIDL